MRFLLLFITLIVGFFEKEVFKIPHKVKRWTIFVLLIIATGVEWVKEDNEDIAKEKQEVIQKIRDSMNAQRYDDSLKAFSRQHSEMLAKYGLKVDSSSKEIVRAIDSSKMKGDEPLLTYPADHSPITIRQSDNDSVVLTIETCNYGATPAYNIAAKLYYAVDVGDKLYRTAPMDFVKDASCPAGICYSNEIALHNRAGRDKFVQYMLLEGKYTNISKTKSYRIMLCYIWRVELKRWIVYGGDKSIARRIKRAPLFSASATKNSK